MDDGTVADMIRHEETALGYLTAAEAAGLVSGNVDAMDSAWIRAELLVTLGEYDGALLCLERLEDRMGLGLHRETQVRIDALRGDIDIRQGHGEQAMARWNACLAGAAFGNPLLEAYVKHTIVALVGFAPQWRSAALTHCDEILNAMERGELPTDGRTDLIGTRSYFQTVKSNLTALGSQLIDPEFIQRLDLERTAHDFNRRPDHFVRQDLIYREFQATKADVLTKLDHLVAWQYASRRGASALDAAQAHVRRACQDRDEDQQFAASANLAAIRHWLGDSIEAAAWYVDALKHPRAKKPQVRRGLQRRLPHALWATRSEAVTAEYPRGPELDLDDALAMKWAMPPSGKGREKIAVRSFKKDQFVTGRLFALEAIAAFRDEGDPGGVQRAFDLLRSAGARDLRSDDDPISLCSTG